MVRERRTDDLAPWLDQMDTCGIAAFTRLARGMRQDEAAIRAALTFPWSNGPVEGTINRLKMIKRSMYDSVGEFPPSSVRQSRLCWSISSCIMEGVNEPTAYRDRTGS